MSRLRVAAAVLTAALMGPGAVAFASTMHSSTKSHHGGGSVSPGPTPSGIASPSPASPSAVASASPSGSPTASPSGSPTASPANSSTPAPTATDSPTAVATSGPWLGILQTTPANAPAEVAAGVSSGDLELSWAQYEPEPGMYDTAYAAAARTRLSELRQAGMRVTLDAGLQYPPSWVFALDSATRFVDQYGDIWQGSSSEDVPNAVFDGSVRSAEAAYIAHVAADLGTGFDAIRAGGLLQNELRYPDATFNGHTNSYWGFDTNAQAHSPVPGWRPGDAGSTQAASFLTYYLQSIDGFESWLLSTYRAAFPSAWLEVLMPSWGLRPGDTDAAMQTNLDGSTDAATWGTLEMGLDWAAQVSALPGDAHVLIYSTWLERGDDGSTPTTMGPAHYLVTIASPLARWVAGENADAGDSLSTMQTVVQHVKSWGLVGLMWLDEPALFGGPPVTLADLSTAFLG